MPAESETTMQIPPPSPAPVRSPVTGKSSPATFSGDGSVKYLRRSGRSTSNIYKDDKTSIFEMISVKTSKKRSLFEQNGEKEPLVIGKNKKKFDFENKVSSGKVKKVKKLKLECFSVQNGSNNEIIDLKEVEEVEMMHYSDNYLRRSGRRTSNIYKDDKKSGFEVNSVKKSKKPSLLDQNGEKELLVSVKKGLNSERIDLEEIEEVKMMHSLVEISGNGGRTPNKQKMPVCSQGESQISFFGPPVSEEEAQHRWGWRYELKNQKAKHKCWKLNANEEDELILNVKCHYTQARLDNCIINLGDCALIKADGIEGHVGKILEFFQTTYDEDYFRVQWFYRAEDTVLQKQAASHDKKRLFYSTVMNDNLLDCIVSKVSVIEVAPTLSSKPRYTSSDFYYDMEYSLEYSTFHNLLRDDSVRSCEPFSPGVSEALKTIVTSTPLIKIPCGEPHKADLALLDLYSGCGGMSTGLCLGAKLSSVNLVTRWAVDTSQAACDSLKLNHPETLVRKLNAEDFLELLKEWDKLCQRYVLTNLDKALRSREKDIKKIKGNVNSRRDVKISAGEFEVQRLIDICYGDPCQTGKRGLYFKVRWLGYSSSDDTWELMESLSNCQARIKDFVKHGYKSNIVPLPGDVDVLCGGPPCQGISGFNRHRNMVNPLTDEKNRQLTVFMDIVKFLKPKYVLMENVNDILKFDNASLGRYALSRLVHMKYQARLGSMASGCYGLPQFRLRVFLWGALPSEKLPQFPLPSHDVVVKYWPATAFERNTVAYDEGQHCDLEEAVILRDAISDLPRVISQETRDQMSYELPPETEFQKFIRLTKEAMMGLSGERSEISQNSILYDHRPLPLTEDENLRVSQIPHKKGANFRDLPGVIVRPDNVAYWDPKNKTTLPSGKSLVPDSSFNFEQGKSKRPYGRIWWDETVSTILTFPNIRAQAVLHPDQDRVFTVREFARLQGFPDYYRFCGSVKERYRQVGNAVSVPVARALGYCLGMASRRLGGNEPLLSLPPKFAYQQTPTYEIH